jgi:hypothetical protein
MRGTAWPRRLKGRYPQEVNRCIYCRSDFASAAGEHILQNALGARWTSEMIVCDTCQKLFGETIDIAVGKAFAWLRNLFDIDTGRRKRASTIKRVATPSGRVVDLEPGGLPRLSQPHIEIEGVSPNKALGHISAGNQQQVEWALKMLQDRFPGAKLDRSSLAGTQRPVSAPLGEPVVLNVSIGGVEYSRGILKSCFNLYAACFPDAAQRDCFGPLRDFVLHAKGEVSDFHRWPAVADHLPRATDLEHRVAIVRRRRCVEGVVSLFGHITQVVRLSEEYDGEDAQACNYLVDPLREREPAEARNPPFEEDRVLRFADQPPWLQAKNKAILVANLQEPGAVLWRRSALDRIAENLQALEARYEKLRPLTADQEEARQRQMRDVVASVVKAALDSAYVSEDSI